MLLELTLAVSTLLAPEHGLQWDPVDAAEVLDGFHVWYTIDGGPIEPPVILWRTGPWPVVLVPDPDPLPACCWERPQPPPGCRCAAVMGSRWGPWFVSPVRELPSSIEPGAEVCAYVRSFRAAGHPEGAGEGAPSNTVCFGFPEVCEFTTRDELLGCLAAPEEGLSWDREPFGP